MRLCILMGIIIIMVVLIIIMHACCRHSCTYIQLKMAIPKVVFVPLSLPCAARLAARAGRLRIHWGKKLDFGCYFHVRHVQEINGTGRSHFLYHEISCLI